MGRTLIHKSTC